MRWIVILKLFLLFFKVILIRTVLIRTVLIRTVLIRTVLIRTVHRFVHLYVSRVCIIYFE